MTVAKDQVASFKGLALLADDLRVNRKLLSSLLQLEGYQTILAENGAQAVQLYTEHKPDIIFMDAMMPVMDGYQATAQIKALAGMNFVPIIFLTALSEGDALVKCIEAGGDDFLSKPFKQEILRAKIQSMERIRDLSRKVVEQHEKIEGHRKQLLEEQLFAEQIYKRAITGGNTLSQQISSLLLPVSVFSGDLLLSANSPGGQLYILLGDFTGHGLAAAVGVLPTAEVFRAMTAKGFLADEILIKINSKLHELLPTGMFLAACFVVIEKDLQSITIWNAGMPEVLIFDAPAYDDGRATLKHRVESRYLPLGILNEIDLEPVPLSLKISRGDRVILCSDGVCEAVNNDGESFGFARYEQAASEKQPAFEHIISELKGFCGTRPFADDVSLVEIQCLPGLHQADS